MALENKKNKRGRVQRPLLKDCTSVTCADPKLCYIDGKGNRVLRHFSYLKSSIGGIPLDHIVFDCGTCRECRNDRALELATKCVLHASCYEQNSFLTWTYDEEKPDYNNRFHYPDIQAAKKNLREFARRELGRRIEVFNVHEYGKNRKKHWHLIVFNYRPEILSPVRNTNYGTLYTSLEMQSVWPHGFNSVGDVSEASAMYQAQYMEKDLKYFNTANEYKCHSKHSGLGRPYFEKHYRQILQLGFVPFGGRKVKVPRYFEKLAHKHFCHFFDPSKFYDTAQRRALYRPFEPGLANYEIAELFKLYRQRKDEIIFSKAEDWYDTITDYLYSGEDPDFIKSASNKLYDIHKKPLSENF